MPPVESGPIARALREAVKDREQAELMRQPDNRAALIRRAEATESLARYASTLLALLEQCADAVGDQRRSDSLPDDIRALARSVRGADA